MRKEYISSPDDVMEHIAQLSNSFDSFSLYEDGKLIISTTQDAHIVMQFDNRRVAENWLVEHFDRFKLSSDIVQ